MARATSSFWGLNARNCNRVYNLAVAFAQARRPLSNGGELAASWRIPYFGRLTRILSRRRIVCAAFCSRSVCRTREK